jgi:magnesium and cobalt transporter
VRLLARHRPNRFLVGSFPALAVLRRLTTPLRLPAKLVAWLLFRVRLEEGGPGAREEIRIAVEEGERDGSFTHAEAGTLSAVLDLPEKPVGDVLTSRGEMTMLRADAPLKEAVQLAQRTGYSRFPVYGRDRDEVLGYVTVRDLLAHWGRDGESVRVRDILRRPFFVPESKNVRDLLEEMRQRRAHLAVVLNEFGGTAGLVTIEDLLEAIVGDIGDEYDAPVLEAPPEGPRAGVLDVDGRTPIEEVNRALRVELPVEEDFETVGGLVLHRLGKVPRAGDQLTFENVALTVTEADERTVRRLKVQLLGHQG